MQKVDFYMQPLVGVQDEYLRYLDSTLELLIARILTKLRVLTIQLVLRI